MKCKVQLFLGGKVFDEYVEARNYQDARVTALARNPTATVIGVTAVFGNQDPDHPNYGKTQSSSTKPYVSQSISNTSSGNGDWVVSIFIGILMGIFRIFQASCNKWGVKNTLIVTGGIILFLWLVVRFS